MVHYLSLKTQIIIIVFLFVYLTWLLRKAVKDKLDLYDFILLSTIGIIPCLFAIFPKVVIFISTMLGIEFPFVLLFASIHFVSFIFLYSLVRRIVQLNKKVATLTQEIAILHIKKPERLKTFVKDGEEQDTIT